jgi:hypothetical protein
MLNQAAQHLPSLASRLGVSSMPLDETLAGSSFVIA